MYIDGSKAITNRLRDVLTGHGSLPAPELGSPLCPCRLSRFLLFGLPPSNLLWACVSPPSCDDHGPLSIARHVRRREHSSVARRRWRAYDGRCVGHAHASTGAHPRVRVLAARPVVLLGARPVPSAQRSAPKMASMSSTSRKPREQPFYFLLRGWPIWDGCAGRAGCPRLF